MPVSLFDVENGVLVPGPHCYSLKALKGVIEQYPEQEEHTKIFLYIFYMLYPDPKQNPFFDVPQDDKEEMILKQLQADFDTDDPVINIAMDFCKSVYDTPTHRAYRGIKMMMDKLANFMETQPITVGRDGSLQGIVNAVAKFQEMRESYKGTYKDLMDEQSKNRGGEERAYDQ